MSEIELRIENLGKARLLGHFESGSEEWHEARAGIGGSDIGTICGINQYKTREDLLNERRTGVRDQTQPNLAMRMGTAFEPAIRRLWSEDNWFDYNVYETGTWVSNENPIWKANPDGILKNRAGDLGILEIKNSMASTPPTSWIYQVNWYMMTLGLSYGIIVQCRGNKLVTYELEADQSIFDEMRQAALLFEREL